jgi:hypothetical protein
MPNQNNTDLVAAAAFYRQAGIPLVDGAIVIPPHLVGLINDQGSVSFVPITSVLFPGTRIELGEGLGMGPVTP